MRRHHNIFVATLLIFAIIFLSAPPEGSFVTRLHRHRAAGSQKSAGTTLHEDHTTRRKSQATTSIKKIKFLGTNTKSSFSAQIGSQQAIPPVAEQPQKILPPSEPPSKQPAVNSNPLPFTAEFKFQEDLNVEFPFSALQQFSAHAPLHYDANGPPTYAYATFMATRNPSLKDPYFLAILSVIHRVLWSPLSRTQKYPFVVFVADFVTSEQRALLSGAGALVRELAPLQWHCSKPGYQKRWNDLFAKLNMWDETDFSRILFLDADAFPLQNIDDMFDVAPARDCLREKLTLNDILPKLENVCTNYIFAGVPQSPFSELDPEINVGSMVFTPSKTMHTRLLQNYRKTDEYNCAMAEQAFLNWQFSPDGAFPPTKLDRTWGAFFPREEEKGLFKVVHEKLWIMDGWLGEEWRRGWVEMFRWFESPEFVEARKNTN